MARGVFEGLHDRLPPGAVFTSSETRLHFHRERIVSATDLERWAERTLVPRHEWFVDSVHLTDEGQTRIGIYMAEQLAPEIRAQDAAAVARDR